MSANMNLVVVAGNLTRAPELRYTPGGTPVTSFAVAVNRRWKDAQGKMNDEATFIDCDCWGNTAMNVCHYLNKGSPVLLEGHLKLERWKDREGRNRSKLKVVADKVNFLASRRPEPRGEVDELPPDDGVTHEEIAAAADDDDRVPF